MNFFYEKKQSGIIVLRGELEYDAHLHNHIELLYMRRGSIDAYVDGNCHRLNKGDCFIAFPNRVHSYRNGKDDLADVLLISPDELIEFKQIISKQLPSSPHIPNVPDTLASIFDIIYNYKGDYAYSVYRGYCIAIIGTLFEKMKFYNINYGESKAFQRLLEYCNENYKNNISVLDVSKNVGLSPSYISHLFSDKLFISFRQYINSLRINYAIKLIEKDELTLTQVAYETGFSSIRTFNRAFMAHTSCTPSEYKKKNIK